MSCAQRILFLVIALPAGLAFAAPGTQPSAEVWTDPSTPAGAYNAYIDAIGQGDVAKVAAFYDAPSDANTELNDMRAQEQVLQYQVSQEIRKRFPDAPPMLVRGVRPMTHLQPDSWRIEGDQAFASGIPGVPFGPPMVLRDGRWGFRSPSYSADRPEMAMRMEQMAKTRLALEQQTLHNLKAGKFKTADELADALNPYRPMMRQRAQQEQQKFLAQPADPSTIRGVSLAIQQAEISLNADTLAKYYFVKDDSGGTHVAAAAKWFVAETAFHQALMNMQGAQMFDRAAGFCADNPASQMDVYTWTEHDGIATGVYAPPAGSYAAQYLAAPSGPIPTLRKMNNTWQIDISDQRKSRPLEQVLQETQKLQQVTQQIKAGNFKNADAARDACKKAIGTVP